MDRDRPVAANPPSPRRRWVVPVTVAVLAVILVGGVVTLSGLKSDFADSAAGPATTSTVSPTTSTQPTDECEPFGCVPGLGTVTWTQMDPAAVQFLKDAWTITFSPDYEYRFFDWPGVWESSDGLDWSFRETPADFGDLVVEDIAPSGSALGVSADGRYTVVEWTDVGWVEVADLDPITETTGIVWSPNLDHVVLLDDVVYANVTLDGNLQWGEIYGYYQRASCVANCDQRAACISNCRLLGPKATWDATSQTLHLVHPFDPSDRIASLSIDVDGDTASFVDVDAGAVVHEVMGTAGLPIEDIVGAIERETPTPRLEFRLSGGLVSSGGASFVFRSPPWTLEPPYFSGPPVFAAPDGSGFVAFEQERDTTTDSTGRESVIGGRTWASTDGLTWIEADPQPFPYPWPGGLEFRARTGAIVAGIFSTTRSFGIDNLQLWDSDDGISWTERPAPPPESFWSSMEFGYVAVESFEDESARGPWHWRYSVLGDGDAWIEVVGPPDQPVALGDDTRVWNREVGSVMYWGYSDAAGDTVWVGRFDP